MKVRDFMKKDPITADIKTPIMEALEIMRKNKIKRLPVTKGRKFVGLVTRAMIRDASPSQATSLSVHELNYLISRMTLGDIMVKDPITITPDLPVEEAIWLGKEKGVGAFPVTEGGKLVGIITESDISGVVSEALGLGKKDSSRITLNAGGPRFGYLRDAMEVLDDRKIPLMSIMSVPRASGDWYLILRLLAKDAAIAAEGLKEKGFDVMDVN
jgi:acetoin utilization protein AcuB